MLDTRRKLALLTSAVALALGPIALHAQIVPVAPAAQPGTPAIQPADTSLHIGTTRPTTSLTTAPTTQVSMNFVDVPIETVLERLSDQAGFIIIKPGPAAIPGRVTIRAMTGVSPDYAVTLLNSVLMNPSDPSAQHYTAIQMGRILKIETVEQARKGGIPVRTGNDPKLIEPTDELVTWVIPLRTLDAPKLKTDLQPMIPVNADIASNAASNSLIITDTQANIKRIVEIVASMDTRDALENTIKVRQLKYADATAAAKLITDIFKADTASSGGPTNPFAAFGFGRGAGRGGGGPGGGGFPGGGGGGGGGGGDSSDKGQTGKITASADTRTNTIVVTGPTDTIAVIDKMLDQLDADPTNNQDFFMYRVKNGQAVDMQNTLNTLFGNGSVGGTTSSGTSSGFGSSGAAGNAFGSGRSSSGGGGGGGFGSSSGSNGLGSSSFGQTGSTTGGGGGGNRGGGGFGGGSAAFGSTSGGPVSPLADLKGQVYVVADADTNSLLVATALRYEKRVQEIIKELDRAVPQVLIKVLIAEVSHDNNLDAGIDFSALNLRPSGNGIQGGTIFGDTLAATAATGTGAGGLIVKLAETNLTATLRALQTVGKVDVLSRPYILASDNLQASILVGQEVPIITNSQTTALGNTVNNITYQSVGIILNVTPHINPDGLVIMDVAPQISAISNSTVAIASNVTAPIFDNRSAETRVGIRDGDTIVIGGLMQDEKTQTISKVPILGDIPGLGLLFQRNQTDKTKTELLIFLTPHVAQQPSILKPMTQDELKGVKLTPNAVEPGAFQEHMEGMQRGTTQPSEIPEPTVPRPSMLPSAHPASQIPEPPLPGDGR